jgi:hypothetical protein
VVTASLRSFQVGDAALPIAMGLSSFLPPGTVLAQFVASC